MALDLVQGSSPIADESAPTVWRRWRMNWRCLRQVLLGDLSPADCRVLLMVPVSPCRASPFSQSSGCRTTEKEPKGLAPSSGPTASGALTPSSLLATLALRAALKCVRHKWRLGAGAKGHPWPVAPLVASMPLVPCATTAFGLLEGRWRLLQLLPPTHHDVVRTDFRMGRAAFRKRSETHAAAHTLRGWIRSRDPAAPGE